MVKPVQIIRWEQPPSARGNPSAERSRGSKYDKATVELISRPGRWAALREMTLRNSADNLANRIRRGEMSCFPAGEFEAVVRLVGQLHTVYVRYVGEGEPA